MTVETFLSLLENASPSGRGWKATCPGHMDKTPSLHIRQGDDGRVLVHCFSGCRPHEICAALGLKLRDLFIGSGNGSRSIRRSSVAAESPSWRKNAAQLEDHALELWFRAEGILEAAHGLHAWEWTDADRKEGMEVVAEAYADREQAELLENVAFEVRLRGLAKDRKRVTPRNRAA
ncbi:MAG: hypothetical protein H0W13_08955 [Nitrospirales bacterium]|nr:hypothetical protein [Nitrospirales bacterium]